MKSTNELKQQLLGIKANDWNIPENVNKFELALEMTENIGSTDPVLRDELILELLCEMVAGDYLTNEEVKKILKLLLSEKHLFNNLGKVQDDSVFNRAFTVLVIKWIVYRHNNSEGEGEFFTDEEIKWIYREVLRYAKEEKDVRGYVETKGWAHSAAHTSDALGEIALCKELNGAELLEILYVLRGKLLINYDSYINFEDERMISAVVNVLERTIVKEEELIKWLRSFENIELTGTYPKDHIIKTHRRDFLSALYFRLKRKNNTEILLNTIDKVMDHITPDYFK
jgi:hypothetical protein